MSKTPPRRIVCLVADGFGVGEAPDAKQYDDLGSNTLGNTARAVGGLRLPNLEKLGLGKLGSFAGISSDVTPIGSYGRLQERSHGKDTTTGHWELAGLVTREPFETFPNGFPQTLLDELIRQGDLDGVLGNCAASGTTIIEQLGAESVATGKPIVYTSADSVFQIAAHEEIFGLERLHQLCQLARKLTLPMRIGRVIARPFVGEAGSFRRTENRRDYSISPGRNCLDALAENSIDVYGVGKIEDIFAHRSIHRSDHTGNNRDSLRATMRFLDESRGKNSFIFVNLVDFDMLFGHRRDPVGYAGALAELDAFLPTLLGALESSDALFLTSDHGCDPTYRGSDHTREYVPLIGYQPGQAGRALGDRPTFSDFAATVLDRFGVREPKLPDLGRSIFNDRVRE